VLNNVANSGVATVWQLDNCVVANRKNWRCFDRVSGQMLVFVDGDLQPTEQIRGVDKLSWWLTEWSRAASTKHP
jgi:hypothetical protein